MTATRGSQKSQPQQPSGPEGVRESTNLTGRYGRIGILSVAAAVRYAPDDRKPADTGPARIDPRFVEQSA